MRLGRILANAIVRRLAYVLVALLFAAIASLLGMGKAWAQSASACPSSAPCATEGVAHAACVAWGEYEISRRNNWEWKIQCETSPTSNFVRGRIGSKTAADFQVGTFYFALTCGDRSPLGPGAWSGVNSDMQMCNEGCTFEGGIGTGVGVCIPVVVDGVTYQHCTSWGPTGEVCSAGVGDGSLAPPDSDGDGTSDGNDPSPNNPGSGGGGGQDGEGQPEDGSSTCGGPDQPACEADGSNSGSGKGNTSGGGGNCQTPPSSTGDAILAQIAYQAWATRCAVEGLGQGGTGTGPGTGDGDGAKEGTLKGIKDFLDGNGEGVPDAEDPWMDGLPGEPSDWSLGLGGGSCPSPVSTSITFGGVSAPLEFSFQPLCDLAGLLNTVFMALGALIAAYIIAGVRR